MSIILVPRTIGPIPIDCIMKESPRQSLRITDNPIETGSDVTDHVFLEPRELVLEIADTKGAALWFALTQLQESRIPFTVVSGLSAFSNMLIENISATREASNTNLFEGTVKLREIIRVGTSSAVAFASATTEPPASGFEGLRNFANKILPLGGLPGGALSTLASVPIAEIASSSVVDVVSATVFRGESPVASVATSLGKTVLNQVFGQ